MKTPLTHLLWACLLLALHATIAAAARPNVVLIMADDFGYECLGSSGSLDYNTPALDQLAATGVRFAQFHAQPLCTPTRVKLMTGQSNRRNYQRFGLLPRGQTTFAHLFQQAGYRTCIAGKWQLGKEPDAAQHFGFDEALLWQHTRPATIDGHDSRYANPRLERNGVPVDYDGGQYSADLFVDFFENFIDQDRDTPFLIYYPMVLSHCPFSPPPDSAAWDPASRGSTSYKGNPASFAEMVQYVDTTVGRIDAALRARGLRENTLLVFLGDNGTDKPIVSQTTFGKVVGGKGSLTDAGTRVPCVASWPGALAAGHVVHHTADLSDLLPTLCEAADIRPPAELPLDGTSFLANLRGDPTPHRDAIFIWYSRDGSKAKAFARTASYKLYAGGRFYHMATDPLEQQNLAGTQLPPEAAQAHACLTRTLAHYAAIPRPQ